MRKPSASELRLFDGHGLFSVAGLLVFSPAASLGKRPEMADSYEVCVDIDSLVLVFVFIFLFLFMCVCMCMFVVGFIIMLLYLSYVSVVLLCKVSATLIDRGWNSTWLMVSWRPSV